MNHFLKKSFAALLAVLMLLSVMSVAVFAGDGDSTEPPASHTHTYDVNKDPDVPEVLPTCTTTGHGVGWTCTVEGCNEVLWEYNKETLPALGHSMTATAAVAATCTADGNNAYYYCSRCEEYFKDEAGATQTTVAAEKIDKLGHDWDEGTVTKEAASCTEPGEKTFHCKREGCSETKVEAIAAPHTLTKVDAKAATCTAEGNIEYWACSVCHKNFTNAAGTQEAASVRTPAAGHDWKAVKTVPATCKEIGYTSYKCSVCEETKDDDVQDALGHKLVDDPEVPATCQTEGKTAGRHCERCEEVFIKQEVIPKSDHDWEIVAAVAPTCTEAGRTEGAKCKVCGEVRSVSEELPAKGHTYTTEVITPVTCEANGLTKKYCTECNESETLVVPATGHDWSDWIYEENFTCEVGGERYKTCANCGSIGYRETLPPQGHDWSGEWTVDTAPTCTVKGYKSHHCTRCDARNDITTMPKLPHSYLDKGTKATTKRDGLITGVCAVCGLERKPLTVKRVKTFTLSKTSYIYDGKAKKPSVVVKDAAGKKLQKDTDYKLTYASGRKKVGSYVVKITLIGNYSGTKKLKFTIKLGTPKGLEAKTSAAKQAIKVSCAALKGAKKYVFYYSTEKDGGYKKLAVAAKPAVLTKALKPGTYYFKVRALTTDKNGDKAYSAASSALKVKLAKAS